MKVCFGSKVMQAPGAVIYLCWQPVVGYFESGLE